MNAPVKQPDEFPDHREISPAAMIRRGLFLVLVVGLSLFYLTIDFPGLSHPLGMDQAQISREIARGHGFSTKCIRPVALYQINKHNEETSQDPAPLAGLPDTYHAPLNPLFNALLLWANKGKWEYDGSNAIYSLDLVIAAGSVVLLLCSIGVSYLLIARIFDTRIAGFTAFLLLLCELLWKFSQSGLPQMLMLFLFSFALYFLYKALENHNEAKSPYLWAALAGGFFGLLALSHWITVWAFAGVLLFSAVYFRPRGIVAVVMFVTFGAIIATWLIRNAGISGDPAGTGRYVFYSGLPNQTQSSVMRNADPESEKIIVEGLVTRTVKSSLSQLNELYIYLGSVVAAPLFFLALLHPFRRPEIAHFRWCILLMWILATIGMSLFGLTEGEMDPNQIHVLFIPIMTGYGLAFLSILWNRLDLPVHYPLVRDGHFILAIIISALPMLLTLPTDVKIGMIMKDRSRLYPPYSPPLIASLDKLAKEHEVIVSDMPWAVAWYADRMSLWLPRTVKQFDTLYTYAADRGQPLAGLYLTPVTTNEQLARVIAHGEYNEWAPLIIQGPFGASSRDTQKALQDFPFTSADPRMTQRSGEMMYLTEKSRLPQ